MSRSKDLKNIDWDDAFDNFREIDPALVLSGWRSRSVAFLEEMKNDIFITRHQRYGDHEKELFDLFEPRKKSLGTIIFVHGGYWMRTVKADWSFVGQGLLAAGWSVAVVGYPQVPAVRIADITHSIEYAIRYIGAMTKGSIRLVGHSSGGHLVCRMLCGNRFNQELQARIEKVISISGIHDLRPLLYTKMNLTLNLDHEEARQESTIFSVPKITPVLVWVGGNERPEFLRQSQLLFETWARSSNLILNHFDQGHDHFSVVEQLAKDRSDLLSAVIN